MIKRLDLNLFLMVTGLLVGAGLGFALLGFFSGQGRLPGMTNEDEQIIIGQQAPDFKLMDLNQVELRLSQLAGHPVVINFWATWCGPCKIEMPILEAAFQTHSSEVIFLAVNFDEAEDDVADFVQELGLTFPVLLDSGGEVADLYHVQAFPTTYFIDDQSVIRAVHLGTLSERQLGNYLANLGVEK